MNITKQIFKDLYESINGLYAFTFYSRYNLAPSVLFQFIEKYKANNIISFVDGKINLTKEGQVKAEKFIYTKTLSRNKFANIPKIFLDYKINIDSLYIPDINCLN